MPSISINSTKQKLCYLMAWQSTDASTSKLKRPYASTPVLAAASVMINQILLLLQPRSLLSCMVSPVDFK
jgi:hypothetical protein